ncbi:MAG TPA: YopT-type cysteine protease domain-containing protein, partial [Burkholderiaceae bacterium]|nr:YopT-type cysteine protease domain-containing protein [Burkholderiaceae bacterium]
AFSAMGIGIDRYRLFTCQPRVEPVIDVAERVARHMSRGGPYHLLSFSTDNASHAIACIERAHSKYCLFDPNLGSLDVDRRMLPDLLASLLAAFARTQAEIDSPSDGTDHLDAADVAPHNLRAVCVSPVLIAEPSHGRS